MPDKMGFEEAALQRIGQMLGPMSEAAATMMGLPPGGQKYSKQQMFDQWNYSPIASPQVRVEAMLELKQAGKTPEEITDAIYPNRRRIITTGRPQISEQIAFAEQMDREMSSQAEALGTPLPSPEPLPTMPAPPPTTVAPVHLAQQADMIGQSTPSPLPQPAPMTPQPAPSPAGSMLDQPFSAPFGG